MTVGVGSCCHRLAGGSHAEVVEEVDAFAVAAVAASFANVDLAHYTLGMRLESCIAAGRTPRWMLGLAQASQALTAMVEAHLAHHLTRT